MHAAAVRGIEGAPRHEDAGGAVAGLRVIGTVRGSQLLAGKIIFIHHGSLLAASVLVLGQKRVG